MWNLQSCQPPRFPLPPTAGSLIDGAHDGEPQITPDSSPVTRNLVGARSHQCSDLHIVRHDPQNTCVLHSEAAVRQFPQSISLVWFQMVSALERLHLHCQLEVVTTISTPIDSYSCHFRPICQPSTIVENPLPPIRTTHVFLAAWAVLFVSHRQL